MTVDKDKLSRRVKQSTQPGPWKALRSPDGTWRVIDANGFWGCDVGEDPHQAKYIAEAHPQAIEAVLAELAQLGTQLDARIAWQVQAVAHMQTWRALFDAAVAMREGHEGCVTEPKCGSCFRCDFNRAVDEAMTAVAAGSEKFIEDSTLKGQLDAAIAEIERLSKTTDLGIAIADARRLRTERDQLREALRAANERLKRAGCLPIEAPR